MDELPLPYPKFWELIDNTAPRIIKSVYEIAEENDYNLEEELIEYVRETLESLEDPEDDLSTNPMLRLAAGYSSQTEVWLKNHQQRLSEIISADLSDFFSSPDNATIHPKEYLNIIKAYQHKIYVKVLQSVEKLQEQAQQPQPSRMQDTTLLEAYGMAKVNVSLIDRSIAAWGLLSDYIPESNDSIFKHLILLEKLRTYVLAVFPQVKDFIRPGFDQRTK